MDRHFRTTGHVAADAYAAVSGVLDTFKEQCTYAGFRLSVGATNGATFKIQGSIDGTNYADIVGPIDAVGAEDADGEVAVAADGATHLFLAPGIDSGAKIGWRYDRVMVKNTSAGNNATVAVEGYCK